MRTANVIAALVELSEAHRLVTRAGEANCYSAPNMVVNAAMALGLAREYLSEDRAKHWKAGNMADHRVVADANERIRRARNELANMVYNIRYVKRGENALHVVAEIEDARDILIKGAEEDAA